MRQSRLCSVILAAVIAAFVCFPAYAEDFEYHSTIEPTDDTSRLLAYYVGEFSPEELTLITAGGPDATGHFNDIYMDIKGVKIEDLRISRLTFRMYGAQFNPPKNWAAGEVECTDALQIYARAELLQDDINRSLAADTFGDDDHWQNVSLQITPTGLKGSGYYMAKVMFVTLDIRIDIDSGLRIQKNKELWLDNPQVKVNKLDLPDYITNKALSQIQPLIDLSDFPLPLRLHRVMLEDGRAELSTRVLPEPIENGTTYRYTMRNAE